jgi:hypothetical protein
MRHLEPLMKTLAVAVLFALSLVSLFASVRADALSQPRIETGLAQPQRLVPDDDEKGGEGDKKGGDDEKDEEEYRAEYRAISQRAALELVDPGALDHLLRVRAAVRASR